MQQREPRRQRAAEGVARERDLVEAEPVEEVEVVQVVVVQAVDARVVRRGAEARMDGHDQPAALGQRQERVEAGDRAAAVQEHERSALAGAEDGGLDAVDVVSLLEIGRHCAHPR